MASRKTDLFAKAVGRTATASAESARRVVAEPERRGWTRLHCAVSGNRGRDSAPTGRRAGDECGPICPVVERVAIRGRESRRGAGADAAAGDQRAQIGTRTVDATVERIYLKRRC